MESVKITSGISSAPIELIDTTDMTEAEWLATREHGIGKDPSDPAYIPFTITGSGAASAVGDSPYISDIEYRELKMGVNPKIKVVRNAEEKEAGHCTEPFVALNFLRYMHKEFPGIKIRMMKDMLRDILPYLKDACPDAEGYKDFCNAADDIAAKFKGKWGHNPSAMYQCGAKNPDGTLMYPWALANIDGLVEVNGQLGIFEAKTTSSISAWKDWQAGIIPKHYEWQLRFYMAVMDLPFAYITCCRGVTLNDTVIILLERDKEIEDKFMDELDQFVKDMAEGKETTSKSDPDLVANWYQRKFGIDKENRSVAELPATYQDVILEAIEADKAVADAEKALEEANAAKERVLNNVRASLGTITKAKIEMPDKKVFQIEIKPSMHRAKFREDDFVAEHPDIAKEFTVETLNVTALKKSPKYKKLASEYVAEPEPNEKGKTEYSITEYWKEADEVRV